MNEKERVLKFLSSDKRVFFLRGKWGVGKTTVVRGATTDFKNRNKKAEIINLSLFGISNVKELNSLLLGEIRPGARIAEQLFDGAEPNGSLGVGPFTVGMSLSPAVFFQLLVKMGPKKAKRYVIVIDDIERKDVHLSLEEIFGFVDHVVADNVQAILIANSEKMEGDESFNHFKEKVVDEECVMDADDEEVKRLLFGYSDRMFERLEVGHISNLRTLQRYAELIDRAKLTAIPENMPTLYAAKYALEALCDGKYGSSELKDEKIRLAKLMRDDPRKTAVDFDESHLGLSAKDVFVEYWENNEVFKCLHDAGRFLSKVYDLVSLRRFEELKMVEPVFESSPYPKFGLAISYQELRFYSDKRILLDFSAVEKALLDDYDKVSVFASLAKYEVYLSKSPGWTSIVADKFNQVMERCIDCASRFVLGAPFDAVEPLSSVSNWGNDPVPDSFKNHKITLLNKIWDGLHESMASFAFWESDKKEWVERLFNEAADLGLDVEEKALDAVERAFKEALLIDPYSAGHGLSLDYLLRYCRTLSDSSKTKLREVLSAATVGMDEAKKEFFNTKVKTYL